MFYPIPFVTACSYIPFELNRGGQNESPFFYRSIIPLTENVVREVLSARATEETHKHTFDGLPIKNRDVYFADFHVT